MPQYFSAAMLDFNGGSVIVIHPLDVTCIRLCEGLLSVTSIIGCVRISLPGSSMVAVELMPRRKDYSVWAPGCSWVGPHLARLPGMRV